MTERDYAPLSGACVRGLCDKLYEKRKFAGVEIEKYKFDLKCLKLLCDILKSCLNSLVKVKIFSSMLLYYIFITKYKK